ASVVIDCNSSPTAETIWSLMVSARVWLTRWAVRHHNKCTPTALTTIDVRTRAEMALRMPMRIEVLCGLATALRDHISVCFTAEAIPPRRTRLGDHSGTGSRRNLSIACSVQARTALCLAAVLEGHAMS